MDLHQFALTYLAERPGLSAGYKRLVVSAVERLCATIGRMPAIQEVDRAMLASYAEERRKACAASTVNAEVRRIRGLLLAAYDDGAIDRPPRRVRRLQETTLPPEAWTVEEVRHLLAHLSTLPGQVGEVPASWWWSSLVLVTYWTAARISSLRQCAAGDYAPGRLLVRESKTGKAQWHTLPSSCCEAIEAILPDAGLLWPWPACRRTFFARFRQYVDEAGLYSPRGKRNLFYKVRRTHASYCAADDPALAQASLGHSSYEITRKHYVDPSFLATRSPVDVLPDPTPTRPRLRVVG